VAGKGNSGLHIYKVYCGSSIAEGRVGRVVLSGAFQESYLLSEAGRWQDFDQGEKKHKEQSLEGL